MSMLCFQRVESEIQRASAIQDLKNFLKTNPGTNHLPLYNLIQNLVIEKGGPVRIVVSDAIIQAANGFFPLFSYSFSVKSEKQNIELGKSIRFPRGFFVVLNKVENRLVMNGFMPKFQNDIDYGEFLGVQSSSKLLQGATTVQLTHKISGSLALVMGIEVQGQMYVFTATKTVGFVDDVGMNGRLQSVVERALSFKALERLREGWTLAGEVLLETEHTHGYPVHMDWFIVHWCNPPPSADVPGHDTIFHRHDLTPMDINRFCIQNDLKCLDVLLITGPIQSVVTFILAMRDFMTLPSLCNIIREAYKEFPDFVRMYSGSAPMRFIINSEVTEGLVAHIYGQEEHGLVVKVKFPRYTIRTMFLRSIFALPDSTARDHLRALENFARKWCSTEEGRNAYVRLGKAYLVFAASISRSNTTSDFHLRVAENVDSLSVNQKLVLHDSFDSLMSSFSQVKKCNLVIVAGAIGSGKSTFMRHLVDSFQQAGKKAACVDGDEFDGSLTLYLNEERNNATQWRVLSLLMAGYTVVLSTGGGALIMSSNNKNGRPVVNELADLYLPEEYKIRSALLIMQHKKDSSAIASLDKGQADFSGVIQACFRPVKTAMEKVYKYRIENGMKTLNVQDMMNRSSANCHIVQQIAGLVDDVYTVSGDFHFSYEVRNYDGLSGFIEMFPDTFPVFHVKYNIFQSYFVDPHGGKLKEGGKASLAEALPEHRLPGGCHMTWDYSTVPQVCSLEEMQKVHDKLLKISKDQGLTKEITGLEYDQLGCKHVVVELVFQDGKKTVVSFLATPLVDKHITDDAGPILPPVEVKWVHQGWRCKQSEITVTIRKVEYVVKLNVLWESERNINIMGFLGLRFISAN